MSANFWFFAKALGKNSTFSVPQCNTHLNKAAVENAKSL